MSALHESKTYVPSSENLEKYAKLHDFNEALQTKRGQVPEAECFLSGPEPGQQVVLPKDVYELLVAVVDAMQQGMAVTIRPNHERVTTQQAADLLGVSRPTVVRLVENGELPATKIGRHRRILLVDVLEYQKRHETRQFDAIAATSDLDAEIPPAEFFKSVRAEVAAERASGA